MILDFCMIKNNNYDCIQSTIVASSMYYQKDFQMISLGRWNFQYYSSQDNSIGNCLKFSKTRIREALSKFHGIDVIKAKSKPDIFLIKEQIELGHPVIVESDLYNCSWNSAYKKYHFPHFFIVYGYIDLQKEFVCCDSYFYTNEIYIGYQELSDIILDFRYLDINSNWVLPNSEDYLFELQKDIREYKNIYSIENMKFFAKDITSKFDIQKEIKGFNEDFFAVPILDNLRILVTNKMGYVEMLKYLNNINNVNCDFSNCIEIAIKCANQWQLIRLKFMKLCYSPKVNINEIVDMIYLTIMEEEKFISSLSAVCDKSNYLAV